MSAIEDLSRNLVPASPDSAPQLGAIRRSQLPAEQLNSYTPEQMAQLGGSQAPRLGAQSSAIQAPAYSPESAPRLGAIPPSPIAQVGANAAAEAPGLGIGPLARAAGLAAKGLGIGAIAHTALSAVDPSDKAGSWIDKNVPGASWIDNAASKIGLGRSYAEQGAAGGAQPTIAGVGAGIIPSAAAATLPQAGGASGESPAPNQSQAETSRLQADTTARTANGPLNVPMQGGAPTADAPDQQFAPGASDIAYQKAGASGLKNLAAGETPTFVMGDGREVAKSAMTPDDQAALARWNDQQAQQYQAAGNQDSPQVIYTGQGPLVNGVKTPEGLLAPGMEAQLKNYLAASQQGAVNQADPLAAETRSKVAIAAGDPSMGNSGSGASSANGTDGQMALTGEDFLKTLPSGRASLLRAAGTGNIDISPILIAKNPGFMQQLTQAYPDFDVKDMHARANLMKDAATGVIGKSNNALNTGIGHLDALNTAIDGLHNRSFLPWNALANQTEKVFGATGMTDFDAVVNRVAPELTKIWRGVGGAEADISRDIDSLSSSHSPEQLHSAVKHIVELIQSKIEANKNQYDTGMGSGKGNKSAEFITPKSQAILDKINGKATPPTDATKPPIPAKAIDHLKANPETRSYFEAKYGKGSADSILRGPGFADGGLVGGDGVTDQQRGKYSPGQQGSTVSDYAGQQGGPAPAYAGQQGGMQPTTGAMRRTGSANAEQILTHRGGEFINSDGQADNLNSYNLDSMGIGANALNDSPIHDMMQGGIFSRYKDGGQIQGPGTGTSDSIPAVVDGHQPIAVSNGEYIIPAAVVKRLGTKYFDNLLKQNQED